MSTSLVVISDPEIQQSVEGKRPTVHVLVEM